MEKIVFFDGYCGLCNGFVDFLIRRNSKRRFLFATLQGKVAEKLLAPSYRENLETIVYYRDQKVFERSTAALEILRDIGGLYNLLVILYLVPRFVRDFIYNKVAKNRYKMFGKRETCRLPTPTERSYFLD